jgi:hypothetical protein
MNAFAKFILVLKTLCFKNVPSSFYIDERHVCGLQASDLFEGFDEANEA